MSPKPGFELIVYGLVIVLCLIALVLAATSPAFNFDAKVVYRGF